MHFRRNKIEKEIKMVEAQKHFERLWRISEALNLIYHVWVVFNRFCGHIDILYIRKVTIETTKLFDDVFNTWSNFAICGSCFLSSGFSNYNWHLKAEHCPTSFPLSNLADLAQPLYPTSFHKWCLLNVRTQPTNWWIMNIKFAWHNNTISKYYKPRRNL